MKFVIHGGRIWIIQMLSISFTAPYSIHRSLFH